MTHGLSMLFMATMSPIGSPSRFVYDRLLSTVEAETDGRYTIVPYFNGELGPEESYFNAMRRGRIHLSAISSQAVGTAVPEYSILRAPYLFESFEELSFVYSTNLLELMYTLFAEKNMVHLEWAANGWENIYSQKPIRVPEDVAGYRIRVPLEPNAALFFGTLEADVIQIPFTDIIPSLQTGLIDGGESTTLMYVQASLYTEAQFLTRTRHGFSLAVYAANKRWYDRLPKDVQTTFQSAYMKPEDAFPILSRQTEAMLSSLSDTDIRVLDLSSEQRARWRQATTKAVDQIIAQVGGRTADLYDLVMEGKREFALKSAENNGIEP